MLSQQNQFFKPGKQTRILSLLEGVSAGSRVSQCHLGRLTEMSGAMVNKYLKSLRSEGTVRLTPVTRKSFEYNLTEAGEAKRRELLGEYCAEIVRIYSSLKASIRGKLDHLRGQGVERLALFGASDTCEVVLSALNGSSFRVLAVTDNDPAKHGSLFHGHVVSHPQVLETISAQAVVITSFGRQDEIHRQLQPLAERRNLEIVRL